VEDTKPSWYLVSEHDPAIAPQAEQFMAKRIGATTETIAASHAAYLAQPVAVASVIKQAVE
jgi:pimeloyl-ACP methyl ester carboxylesterase